MYTLMDSVKEAEVRGKMTLMLATQARRYVQIKF